MGKPIVVFDGECALCNRWVAFLVRRDRHGEFLLAGAAGAVGRAAVASAGLSPEVTASTIVLVRPGSDALTQSDAVLAIARALPAPWNWLAAGRIVPRAARDALYRWVAARRPRLDADDPACGVPPPALAGRWRARLATAADIG